MTTDYERMVERVQRGAPAVGDWRDQGGSTEIWTGEVWAKVSSDRASDWQSIETAPKDGTWILIYAPNDAEPKHHVVRWGRPEWGGGDDTWVTIALGPNPDTYNPEPTHWMRLETPRT